MLKRMKNKWRLIKLSLKAPNRTSSATYVKYPKESTFYGQRVLNLGCGSSTYPAKNVVNLDYLKGEGVDKVWDLSKTPLPFKDGEFDFIIANHILEHVPNWWECFKELARILRPGGRIELWMPGDGSSSQLGYRDHINTINLYSFGGVIGTTRNEANIWEIEDRKHIGDVAKLRIVESSYRLVNEFWIQILPGKLQMWCANHLRNVIQETGVIFVKEGDK